ncbi:hypothetical protein C8J57DRAFT_1286754 [Mycena rebaudengoi]|nr:hypothetical protein C8J57DRAFT_1286754 [Mycena rebaudengoi]
MANIPGKIQNLSDGSTQALQALLHSLAPETAAGNGKLSPAAFQKLSEKLTELVGGDSGEPQNRNADGQLLNEDGDPIIDISEPVQNQGTSAASIFLDDDVPIPLTALPVSEQERRRRERERILDLLEQEEQIEESKEEEESFEQRQETLRKRKQAAEDEKAKLKAAKEMQKKMGKALLQSMSTAPNQSTSAPPILEPNPSVAEAAAPRRSVKFADTEEGDDGAPQSLDWGDVVPARLRASTGRTLMSKTLDTFPMKMHVVERTPGKPPPEQPPVDSDDESEPPGSDSDSDREGALLSDGELAEEADLDFAQHQREIALQYHEKRNKMAEATSDALRSHSNDHEPVKTAEETLSQSSRKPAVSVFQANRLASSYAAATPSSSKSLGPNVIPAASTRTLQRAIRTGKLDSENRLVGIDGESGSENEDEGAMQEILELLKKGEVYNLGPDGNYIHTVPPPSTNAPSADAPTPSKPDIPPPLASRKPPTSKFKLARAGQRPPAAVLSSPDRSGSSTPQTDVARSSPKLASPIAENHPLGSSASRPNVLSSTVVEKPTNFLGNPPVFPMIVDSPSFPAAPRLTQPPSIMRAGESGSSKPAKVSRFLADRM